MTIRGVIPTILKSEAVDPSHDGHVIAWDHAKRRGVLVPGGGSSGGAFEAQTTALISGGEISKVSDTEIHIAAGTGQIVDSYSDDAHRQTPSVVPVSWVEQTLTVPALNTETVQWVFIDSAGAVLFMASFVPSLFRTHIILGVVYADPSQSKIFSALPSPVHLNSRGQLLEDLSILHTKIEGSEIFPNAPPGLTFRVLDGLGFFPGIRAFASPDNPNINNLPAVDPVAFVYMTQLGASLDATDIDPTQYDDGGTLTPLGGSPRTSTIQVVFRGLGGQVVVLWGQEHYSSLNRALNAVSRYLSTIVVPAALKTRRVKLIGLIVLKRTTSDLTDISKCVFFQRGQAIGGATSNVSKLDDLSDVDTTTTLPADQDTLTYDDASGQWVPKAGGSGGIPSRIQDAANDVYVETEPPGGGAVVLGAGGADVAGFNPTSIQLIPPVWLRSDGTVHNSVLKADSNFTAQQQLTLPDATGMVPAVATAETLEDGQLVRTSGKGYKRIPQGADGQVLQVAGTIPAWADLPAPAGGGKVVGWAHVSGTSLLTTSTGITPDDILPTTSEGAQGLVIAYTRQSPDNYIFVSSQVSIQAYSTLKIKAFMTLFIDGVFVGGGWSMPFDDNGNGIGNISGHGVLKPGMASFNVQMRFGPQPGYNARIGGYDDHRVWGGGTTYHLIVLELEP